jgi:hypothetical protein
MIKKIWKKYRKYLKGWLLTAKKLNHLSLSAKPQKPVIIMVFDGKTPHGGWVDRLKGIISFYKISELLDYDFKIDFRHPFDLINFFEPNEINWVPSENDLAFNPRNSMVLYLTDEFDAKPVKIIKKASKKKIFVYSNVDYLPSLLVGSSEEEIRHEWSRCYNELFRPSVTLQQQINNLNLPEKRISFHLRFTSALNDFKDTNKGILSSLEQQKLIDDCLTQIQNTLKAEGDLPAFVFSDSSRFLNAVKEKLPVHIIEGTPLHLDVTDEKYAVAHEKTFIDFLCLASSEKIFLVKGGHMYNSNYSRYASYVKGAAFSIIEFVKI